MIDIAKIKIKAGNGGDGKVSFRREKFIAYGGPDGGDGGRGGNVYLLPDHNLSTLIDFRSRALFEAKSGEPGGKRKRSGISGDDLYIKVPVGTMVYEIRDGDEVLVGDLVNAGEPYLIARGGRGGKGNFRFKSSTNQAPQQFSPGTKGERKELKLEIKLVADVGLVGLPNAGKSTLINQLTNARAKVANYPFTTISPNLGVHKFKDGSELVFADIPGLIEGASEGKGLGDDFLRHIERTRIIVHVVDPLTADLTDLSDLVNVCLENYKVIRQELEFYKSSLKEKPEIVVINKIDISEVKELLDSIKSRFFDIGIEILPLSAATGEGTKELLNRIREKIPTLEETEKFETDKQVRTFGIDDLPNRKIVFK